MQSVDFYYDFSSTNSYFAAFMLPEICARSGAAMSWLPLHSAGLFRGTGFDVMAMTPRKARYLWRDHARYAEATGLPFRRPSRFPIKTALALRCVLAVDRPGTKDEDRARMDLSQALFRSYWERDENIADPEVLAGLISGIRLDPGAIIDRANVRLSGTLTLASRMDGRVLYLNETHFGGVSGWTCTRFPPGLTRPTRFTY